MIIEFTKKDGQKIAIDTDCIMSFEQLYTGTMINTIVDDLEVMNPYQEVFEMLKKYKNAENVEFSKN